MLNFMNRGSMVTREGEDGGGGGGAPAPDAGAPPAAQWYAGADQELIGHIQTKGWSDKPANEVALAAIKAHREAEGFIGVPANQILRLPTDPNDSEGWKAVRQRLGAPADPKEYDFSGVKFADDTAPSESFNDFARNLASTLGLSKDAATQAAGEIAKYLDSAASADTADMTAKLAAEQAALDANWGPNKEANMFIARQAAAKLGITPEEVSALESVAGYAKTMEMFRNIGTKIGEDKFVANPNPAVPGVMTQEQAVARIADLKKDAAWVKRYMDGGTAEGTEMKALISIQMGETDAGYRHQ